MTTRPCGHPTTTFADVELRCGRFGCQAPPRSSLVHVSPGLGERLGWRITGACGEHEDLLRDMARAASPDLHHEYAEPRTRPPDLGAVLDWIHDDPKRCGLDYFSVTTPGAV